MYVVRIRLLYLIPEFLPIRGKRARIYYHGIQQFCINCYTAGHQRTDCANLPATWGDYVQALKDTQIPAHLFDPIENSLHATNNSLPTASTPRANVSESRLRSEILSLIQDLLPQNQSQNSQNSGANVGNPIPNLVNPIPNRMPPPPPPPQINPTPRPITRARANVSAEELGSVRGRGRGRGGLQPQLAESNPPVRGRGRGRATNRLINQNLQLDQNQSFILPEQQYFNGYDPDGYISNQLFNDINSDRGRNGQGSSRGLMRGQNYSFSKNPPQYYFRRG